ncbi:hypothetical protein N7490_010310 [Penicillium lividum]|nr:hypothetical protein N7490_010310 [Penicillium lividum]
MATTNLEAGLEDKFDRFFEKTTVTRSACDAYAEKLGGKAIPIAVQGVCSYTVYVGPNAEYVAQFRFKSLRLNMKTANLAQAIYGEFAPQVTFMGEIGDIGDESESLCIYFMNRIKGISYFDFIIYHIADDETPASSRWRKNLTSDVSRFFAMSWKAPQEVNQAYRDSLYHQYTKDLGLLLISLPPRFYPIIHNSLDSLPVIFSLPMVLLHRDFSVFNIMVNEKSCNLVGVIDWAEAEIAPFGLNLHFYQRFLNNVDRRNGWSRYDDYLEQEEMFWNIFKLEAGGLDSEIFRAVKKARIAGLLLNSGFTPRLAGMPKSVPIRDDESGSYSMDELDALLINQATRFTELI